MLYNEIQWKKLYNDVRGMTTDYDEFLLEFQPDIGKNSLKNKITNLEKYEDEWKESDQLQFADEYQKYPL